MVQILPHVHNCQDRTPPTEILVLPPPLSLARTTPLSEQHQVLLPQFLEPWNLAVPFSRNWLLLRWSVPDGSGIHRHDTCIANPSLNESLQFQSTQAHGTTRHSRNTMDSEKSRLWGLHEDQRVDGLAGTLLRLLVRLLRNVLQKVPKMVCHSYPSVVRLLDEIFGRHWSTIRC